MCKVILQQLEKTEKSISAKFLKPQKELVKSIIKTYEEVWSDSEFYSVASFTIHRQILSYVATILANKIDDDRELTLDEISICFRFTAFQFFPDVRVYKGSECHDVEFLEEYEKENGCSFTL